MRMNKKLLLTSAGLMLIAGSGAGMLHAAQGDGPGAGQGMRGSHAGGHGGGYHKQHRAGGGKHGGFGRDITKADFEKKARERFAGFDANSDGVIDAAEIEAQFAARRERRKARREGRGSGMGGRGGMRGRMMRADTDGDGKVTKAEFDARLKAKFARMDLTNDGQITDEDLPPKLRDRNFLTKDAVRGRGMGRRGGRHGRKMRFGRLRAANTDNNNAVTLDEFMAAGAARFARKDKNGDGTIDQADRDARQAENMAYRVKRFIHRFGPEADAAGSVTRAQFDAKTAERFAKADKNKDGVLTRDEMRHGHGMRHGRKGRRGMHHRGMHHRGMRR